MNSSRTFPEGGIIAQQLVSGNDPVTSAVLNTRNKISGAEVSVLKDKPQRWFLKLGWKAGGGDWNCNWGGKGEK